MNMTAKTVYLSLCLPLLAKAFFNPAPAPGTTPAPPPGPSPATPTDVTLVPPSNNGPIIASITAYNWRNDQTWDDAFFELPLYRTQDLDREKPEFWNFLLDELLLARLDLVLLHGRGCLDLNDTTSVRGIGNMCPRLLKGFVDAVERAGVQDVIRVGMWDDTAMYRTARNTILNRTDDKFDVSDRENWKFFWDYNIKIWFDTIPRYMWYLIDGKPVITSYNLRNDRFSNQQGNASALLDWLKAQFFAAYGVEPVFILENTWFTLDTTINASHALGRHGWFTPPTTTYTYLDFNGETFGLVIPSFRNPDTVPGCGASCREVLKNNGQTLEDGFSVDPTSKMIILEGWTNMIETNGVYRSGDWSYPAQYINIVRKYSDPEPETLQFQAEGADGFFDTTPENLGGEYSNRALDVGLLGSNLGWYVGWTEAGEWIEYKDVYLGCGTYRFTARAATTRGTDEMIRLAVGTLGPVTVANTVTSDNYILVHLGEINISTPGAIDIRLEFVTGGVNLDWFFLKRTTAACRAFGILGWFQQVLRGST